MNKVKKVYVISDLHLGGRPDEWDKESGELIKTGSQICHSYSQLTGFIKWVSVIAEGFEGDTEIVINGDFVDFLADDDFDAESIGPKIWTSNEEEVIVKLKRIIERTREGSDKGPFDALRDFIAKGHKLTLILGNHDVELSLPRVRRHLREVLGTNNGRLNFIYDGEAYIYGGLLIEHGNRYDRWNVIDHSALRQERSMICRGLPVDEKQRGKRYFSPPAGTLMVIHIINNLKQQYRFVDLLKPEIGAVVPILLALEPSFAPRFSGLIKARKIPGRLLRDKLAYPAEPACNGNVGGFQNAPCSEDNLRSLKELLCKELGENSKLFEVPPDDNDSNSGGIGDVGKFLKKFELCYDIVREPLLSTAESAIKWCQNFNDQFNDRLVRCIHSALKRLSKDASFDISCEKDEYIEAARWLTKCGKFETIVFGHTHLPKKIKWPGSEETSALYLNTGTWADVMKIPHSILADGNDSFDTLRQFINAIRKNDYKSYVKRYLSYAEISIRKDGTIYSADLYSYCSDNKNGKPLTDIRAT